MCIVHMPFPVVPNTAPYETWGCLMSLENLLMNTEVFALSAHSTVLREPGACLPKRLRTDSLPKMEQIVIPLWPHF